MTSLSQDERELLALCGKVRDGVVTGEEFARLEARLLADREALDTYLRFMSVCSGMEQTAVIEQTETQREQLVAEVDAAAEPTPLIDRPRVSPGPTSIEPTSIESSPVRSAKRTTSVAIAVIATTAASIVLAWAVLSDPGHDAGHDTGPNAGQFATVASTHQPVWGSERTLQSSRDAQTGEYLLASGAVKVAYANGAELLIQAPSQFALHDGRRVTLRSGVVSLSIPPAAAGFRIDTPFGSAIDHGTRIGVVADSQSGMELHVFEGKAELVAAGASNGTMLAANKAAAIGADSNVANFISADQAYFANSLDDLSVLPIVSGDVELRVRPPRSVRRVRAELVDVGRATVFAEQVRVDVQRDLAVTLASPGKPTSVSANEATLSAGQQVDSFLVHVVLPRDQWRDDAVMVVSGKVKFARPIVGVVAHEPGKLTDDFGASSTDYPRDNGTGLEDSVDGDTTQADEIRISRDQRTLSFRLRVHGHGHAEQVDRVDQLRVLVRSSKN